MNDCLLVVLGCAGMCLDVLDLCFPLRFLNLVTVGKKVRLSGKRAQC